MYFADRDVFGMFLFYIWIFFCFISTTFFSWHSAPLAFEKRSDHTKRISFHLPSLKLTARPWKSPCFLVNTIKMVDFPASYVSLQEGSSSWMSRFFLCFFKSCPLSEISALVLFGENMNQPTRLPINPHQNTVFHGFKDLRTPSQVGKPCLKVFWGNTGIFTYLANG